jgi:hypothetical protein
MLGRLTILRKLTRNHRAYFECKCTCGTVKIIRADNVLSGTTRSCGCLSREKASERLKKLHKEV